jgi:hypothetical protein
MQYVNPKPAKSRDCVWAMSYGSGNGANGSWRRGAKPFINARWVASTSSIQLMCIHRESEHHRRLLKDLGVEENVIVATKSIR